MATSQNGYSAPVTAHSFPVPGGVLPLRNDDTGRLLAWVATQFHNNVERLVWPGNWGYAYRNIRGATGLSNHASGTAIDLNAPKHPLGKAGTFNSAQRAAIRAILNACEGAVRWGGDYSGRKDEMHFEINANYATVQRVLRKLTSAPANGAKPNDGILEKGDSGDAVKDLQRVLNAWYPKDIRLIVDGDFGTATENAVKFAQNKLGITADGVAGPVTLSKLGLK